MSIRIALLLQMIQKCMEQTEPIFSASHESQYYGQKIDKQ